MFNLLLRLLAKASSLEQTQKIQLQEHFVHAERRPKNPIVVKLAGRRHGCQNDVYQNIANKLTHCDVVAVARHILWTRLYDTEPYNAICCIITSNTVPYHTVRDTILHNTLPQHTIRYHTVLYAAYSAKIVCDTRSYSTIQYNMWYHTVAYATTPYNSLQYRTI